MAKSKTSTSKSIIIENGKLFGNFLNKVSMNGKIPDALLTIEEGHVSSNSVDATQTMFSMCMCYIGENNLTEPISIGIPQINILAKKLSTEDQYKITIGEDRIALTSKGKKGALRFRIIPEEDISTALSDDINEESLDLDNKIHFELKGEKVEELQEYLSLVDTSCVIFTIEKGRLFAMSPEADTVGFKVYLCKATGNEELRVASYAEPIDRMLSLLKGAPIGFYLGNEEAIVLEQEGNYWGIGCMEE